MENHAVVCHYLRIGEHKMNHLLGQPQNTKRREYMEKSLLREINDGEDITDIFVRILAFISISAAMVMIIIALWNVFLTM
jgi:hypothetical protein